MKRFLLIFFSLLVCFLILTACAEPSDGLPYWSEAKEYELKRAYNAYQYGVEFDPDSVLLTYFGTYGGYEAVRDVGLGGAIAWAPEIGGHVFAYGNSNGILLYKDGEFIELHIAFREGKITQAELDSLYEVYSTRTDPYNVSLGNTAVSAG